MKRRILLLDCGGTISQRPNAQGLYQPCTDDFLQPGSPLRRKLESLASIELVQLERIDSSQMGLAYRQRIALRIAQNIAAYDGFVLLHGTDTMAESAACLSYMLQDLGKPLVLTGAQLSYFEAERASDAERNLFYAVQCAAEDFGEVLLFFGHSAIRGTRAYKENSFIFEAFASSSLPPLAEAGTLLYLREHRIRRSDTAAQLRCFTDFNPKVAFVSPISGSCGAVVLEALAQNPAIEAILLTGFGSGNLGVQYCRGVEQAVALGKPVCVVSSCIAGVWQHGGYLAGEVLLAAGACRVLGITAIAAGQKIMYALGLAQREGHSGQALLQRVYAIMRQPISGDILGYF